MSRAGRYLERDPPALARVPRLYCRNERVIIPIALDAAATSLVLVPVGAILVGSVHLHFARLARRRRIRRDPPGPVRRGVPPW